MKDWPLNGMLWKCQLGIKMWRRRQGIFLWWTSSFCGLYRLLLAWFCLLFLWFISQFLGSTYLQYLSQAKSQHRSHGQYWPDSWHRRSHRERTSQILSCRLIQAQLSKPIHMLWWHNAWYLASSISGSFQAQPKVYQLWLPCYYIWVLGLGLARLRPRISFGCWEAGLTGIQGRQ